MQNWHNTMRLDPFRLAMLSVHTSPVARLGGKKTGGMNVYVREITRELARRGILVDVFTRISHPDETGKIVEPFEGARLIYLPCGPAEALEPDKIFLHLNEFRDALEAFVHTENIRYDAIFSHYWLSGWVAVQLRRKWGVPVAQMFHTLGRMKNRIADREDALDVRVRGETEIMRYADRVIAATPAERSQMLMLYRADRRKIDILPPGVDLKRFYPGDREAARKTIQLHEGAKLLLFVGRIEPLKGVDIIFEALVHLRETNPALFETLCIRIIGGDPENADDEMRRLQVLREALALKEQVQFIGAQSQDILPDYYRAAEALIMPSDYESFGMVALEAMACSTPVIASEVGGLAFLIEHGVTGFHFPVREPAALAECITSLLIDPERREQMGMAAAEAAKKYSWSKIAAQLLEYFTMLGTKPRIVPMK